MRKIKYQALVIKTRLDNMGSKMHMAGVSEYEVMIDVRDLSLDNGKVDYVTDSEGDEYSYFDGSLKAIRQYTGLKDKNGRDIYEGDACSTDLSRPFNIVVFRNGAFMYKCHHGGQDYYDIMLPIYEDNDIDKHTKVIGNVYENPELLSNHNTP